MESLKERIIRNILLKGNADRKVLDEISGNYPNFNDFKEALIRDNIVSREDILLIFSKEYKIPYLDLDKYRFSSENKKLLPKQLAFKYKLLPISKMGNVLTLATANPLDIIALDDINIACSFNKIGLVLSNEDKIEKVLNELYSEGEKLAFLADKDEEDLSVKEVSYKDGHDLEEMLKESKRAPIVRVVDLIIYEGLKRRSSDIHIEPMQDNLSVRYRIDGVLRHGLTLPKKNQSAILARLKIMASLNITEFRIPQDGRFKIKLEEREIDFRVSSLPTNFGEKIVLRILDRSTLSIGTKKLGFSDVPLKLFEQALSAPFGIILVTGPTGSGKSTTLYSVITQLNTADKNIITIENPVEYQIEGITQIQVKPEIGLGFASCLRTVLRQSPDVIMVGEIRDSETADIAIKASLTGELIFSTLHTNSSAGAITRLVDMHIEPFLLASSLIAATAQRLVRKLCPKCRIKYKIKEELLKKMNFPVTLGNEFYKTKGCAYCNKTGYRGRIALLEVLLIDDVIKEMIIKQAAEEDIIKYAKENKEFTFLKEDGFDKCLNGVTSLEEVLRVTG